MATPSVAIDPSDVQVLPTQNSGTSKPQPAQSQSISADDVQVLPAQGPTIGAQPTTENAAAGANLALPKEVQPLTMPLVKGLIAAHDKLRDLENMTQEGRAAHPILAQVGDVANRIEGLLTGNPTHPEAGIGTGKEGLLTNPVTSALIPGSEGAPLLAEGLEAGANAIKGGVQAAKGLVSGSKAVEEGPGLVKQVIKGKGVAQEPAKEALGSAVEGTGQQATAGIRDMMDKTIKASSKTERAAYDAVNKAAGTDLKDLYDYQSRLQDAIDNPANIDREDLLQEKLKDVGARIAQGEAQATRNLVNAPQKIQEAKQLTQTRYAQEELKKKLFNNESVVSGNVEHGAEEQVNVDSAIRQVEQLDKPSRYAPEGTPTRLEQALGKDGAAKLKQGLYDAQKAGQTALKKQNIAKLIGASLGASGVGYEVVKGVMGH